MKPHAYQQESIDKTFEVWQLVQALSTLLVLPTAAGKTVIMSFIIKRLFDINPNARVLVMAHRKELVKSLERTLQTVWHGAPVGVYSASLKRREINHITIASRDTIAPLLAKRSLKFDLVIVDEAHNIPPVPRDIYADDKENGVRVLVKKAPKKSRYQKILDNLRMANPSLMLLGLTATPYRFGTGLIYGTHEDATFDTLIHEVPLRRLLDEGFLSKVFNPKVKREAVVDTSSVDISGGEFNQKQLAEVSNNPTAIKNAIDEWIRLAYLKGRKHTLVFGVNIEHAEAIQAELQARGIAFPLVTGASKEAHRDGSIDLFLSSRVDGIINVGVFTEGTDFPLIDCLLILRSVHSLALYKQMVGRGMRLSPSTGKVDCMVLDCGGNIERFGPIDEASPPSRRGKPDARTKVCPECENRIAYHRATCPECDYQYPPPEPGKVICTECNYANPPRTTKCKACMHIMVDHAKEASDHALLSDENQIREHRIDEPLRAVVKEHSSGKQYLQLHYHIDLIKSVTQALFIDWPEPLNTRSRREFQRLCLECAPVVNGVAHAHQLINSGYAKQPQVISVDYKGKHPKIVKVTYAETNTPAPTPHEQLTDIRSGRTGTV